MSMLRALSMVGGAGLAGYQKDMEDKKARDERDQDRAWRQEQRDRQRKEWAEQDAEKQRIANAAQDVSPVEVKATKPEEMDNRDVGEAGEQVLPTAGYDVQGRRFADQATAATAAASQNSPQAKTTRMAAALQQRSPERALQYAANARQAEAADLQITEAKQRAADAEWERGLAKVKDENQLAEFLSSSHGDMQGGVLKATAVRSMDRKTFTFNRLNQDGTTTPMTKPFASLDEARMELSRRVTPEQRLAHSEGVRRYEEELKLRKSADARSERHETRMQSIAERQLKAAEAKSAQTVVTPDSTFDLKTATSEAQARIKSVREERTAAGKPMSAQEEAIELQNTIAAYKAVHTQRFISNAVSGALTRASGDPKAYASEYEAALTMGATPAALAAMGHKPPSGVATPGPAPGAQAAPPAARASVPASEPATQPQEAPEGAALDAARRRKTFARQALAGYGSIQRQKDPGGFARAQSELAAATVEADAAELAWNKVATRMMQVQQGR